MQPNPFTSKVETSALFSRLQAFLPDLKKANEELNEKIEKEGAAKYSIEATEDDVERIEMNVTVGVLEEQEEDGTLKMPASGVVEKKCRMNVKLHSTADMDEEAEEDEEEVTITSAEQLRELGYVAQGDVSLVEQLDQHVVKKETKKPLIQVLDTEDVLD